MRSRIIRLYKEVRELMTVAFETKTNLNRQHSHTVVAAYQITFMWWSLAAWTRSG